MIYVIINRSCLIDLFLDVALRFVWLTVEMRKSVTHVNSAVKT